MTKQEELTVLNELVNASTIYPTITSLNMMLKMYKSLPQVKSHRYIVREEVDEIMNKLKEVQSMLNCRIKHSKEWEKQELSER